MQALAWKPILYMQQGGVTRSWQNWAKVSFSVFLFSDLISNITCKLPNHILLRSSRQCGETIQYSVPQQTILCSDVREIPSQWDFSVQLPWKLDCAWTGRLRFPQWHLFHFLHSCTETPPSSPGTLLWFYFHWEHTVSPPRETFVALFSLPATLLRSKLSKCRGDFSGLPRGEFFTWKRISSRRSGRSASPGETAPANRLLLVHATSSERRRPGRWHYPPTIFLGSSSQSQDLFSGKRIFGSKYNFETHIQFNGSLWSASAEMRLSHQWSSRQSFLWSFSS